MKLSRVIITCFLLSSLTVLGQDNVVKLVVAPTNLVLANNIALAYERKINERFSANVKFNFSSKPTIPLQSTLANFASKQMNSYRFNNDLFDDEFLSRGVSFELRYYSNSSALNGLYFSSFICYQKSTVSDFNFFYLDPSVPEGSIGGSVEMGLNFFGGGVGFGNHWTFKEKFSLDILWAGLGLGGSSFKLNGTELPGEDINFPKVEGNIVKFIDRLEDHPSRRFFENGVQSSSTAETITVTSRNIIPYAKFLNISLGIFF
ncbi:MAG: hypothetical protein AB8B72_08185 [Crocinitomicaceae bacterium]